MKKEELTQFNFEIEKEEQDKSGNTFIILGQENNPLCFLVRNQRHDKDNFFLIDLNQREKIYKLFKRAINSK